MLSRSHLNAVAKLREAGIITSNLVVLPNTSNISLANNGVHISLGSRLLTARLADPASGFGGAEEKYLGDLAVKIMEHFLPLFVGTYSAAPYRLDFVDFHPEQALGFLPHELDYTHLRMLWRRWQRQGRLPLFGRPLTPFGPPLLDRRHQRSSGAAGRLRPRLPPDRLPGRADEHRRKPGAGRAPRELPASCRRTWRHLGVFDSRMSLYLPLQPREYQVHGLFRIRGAFYSLFADLGRDMGAATNLQMLLQALAYPLHSRRDLQPRRYPGPAGGGKRTAPVLLRHRHRHPHLLRAPGHPQPFPPANPGGGAGSRSSRRYPGYLRIPGHAYRLALLALIRKDGAELVEMLDLKETLADLEARLRHPELQASSGSPPGSRNPAAPSQRHPPGQGRGFQRAAERYYREELRRRQVGEALAILAADLRELQKTPPMRRSTCWSACSAGGNRLPS